MTGKVRDASRGRRLVGNPTGVTRGEGACRKSLKIDHIVDTQFVV